MTPYYQDDSVTIYHGDCLEIVTPSLLHGTVVVTDPPYPNNGGHFDDGIQAAMEWLPTIDGEAIIFWSELEHPPVRLPLVALHVWHRANVNGRPWEAAYHFCPDGVKRRSEVFRQAAIFDGVGPGCREYEGHPTQKPIALMQRLLSKVTEAVVVDPFAGSGSTLRAAKNLGWKAIGIEIEERYCEISALRCAQEILALT